MFIVRIEDKQIVEIHTPNREKADQMYEDRCTILGKKVKLLELIDNKKTLIKENIPR
jgi:hypothetical protein